MGDTWIIAMWDAIKAAANGIVSFFVWLYTKIMGSDIIIPSAGWCIFWIIFLTILIISGAYSQSIAYSRRYKQIKFFLFGVLMPVGYPLYLLFNLPIYGDLEMKELLTEKKLERQEQKRLEEAAQAAAHPEAQNASVWNQAYFESISRLSDGSYAGPWSITFNETDLTALRILETTPDFVQAEIQNDDASVTIIRMPYKKISRWDNFPDTPH